MQTASRRTLAPSGLELASAAPSASPSAATAMRVSALETVGRAVTTSHTSSEERKPVAQPKSIRLGGLGSVLDVIAIQTALPQTVLALLTGKRAQKSA